MQTRLSTTFASLSLLALGSLALGSTATAQAPGLRIFQPVGAFQTQIVDDQGTVVHTYPGTGNLIAHIEPDGSLVRGVQTGTLSIGGSTGRLQRLDFDGNITWDVLLDGPTYHLHHDVEPLPNGNVLVIAWDGLTVADAIAAGRDPATITGTDWFPDAILELEQTGPTTANIVWEWHMMDHIVQDFDPTKPNYGTISQYPGRLDINFPALPQPLSNGDWNHFNGLDYDPVHDWILFSARMMSEIYIIDHSTTTAEAASHTGGTYGKGGDFLWRWGNPEAYGAGTSADRQLYFQHDPRFIEPGYPGGGNITVFNNEYLPNFPGQSAVFEMTLPTDTNGAPYIEASTGQYGPAAPVWVYTDPSFLSLFVSSAERLPNGNTLICSGLQNTIFEVDPSGTIVWNFNHPGSTLIFQANYVERSLWNSGSELSASGGQIDFDRLVGSGYAGQVYLLLGSLSGTSPGTPVPGGVTLPLNADYLTGAMAELFNSGVFIDTIGDLDADGHALSTILVGPGYIPAPLVGVDMHFADLIFDSTTLLPLRTTNPVKVTITP